MPGVCLFDTSAGDIASPIGGPGCVAATGNNQCAYGLVTNAASSSDCPANSVYIAGGAFDFSVFSLSTSDAGTLATAMASMLVVAWIWRKIASN